MPLSEYEQRVLEQMERQLSSDDPKLVQALQGGTSSLRRWLLAGLGALIGLGVLVTGAVTGIVAVGVLGFVLMLAAAMYAITPPRRRGPAGTVRPDGSVQRPKRRGRMERLEQRWERRRDQRDR